MAIYRTGTAEMTADGVITGTGTNWKDAQSICTLCKCVYTNLRKSQSRSKNEQ